MTYCLNGIYLFPFTMGCASAACVVPASANLQKFRFSWSGISNYECLSLRETLPMSSDDHSADIWINPLLEKLDLVHAKKSASRPAITVGGTRDVPRAGTNSRSRREYQSAGWPSHSAFIGLPSAAAIRGARGVPERTESNTFSRWDCAQSEAPLPSTAKRLPHLCGPAIFRGGRNPGNTREKPSAGFARRSLRTKPFRIGFRFFYPASARNSAEACASQTHSAANCRFIHYSAGTPPDAPTHLVQ